jgi:hypothetical protein
VEQGVLGNAGLDVGFGTPELGVKAGALLGLNDSDAGIWMEEL